MTAFQANRDVLWSDPMALYHFLIERQAQGDTCLPSTVYPFAEDSRAYVVGAADPFETPLLAGL